MFNDDERRRGGVGTKPESDDGRMGHDRRRGKDHFRHGLWLPSSINMDSRRLVQITRRAFRLALMQRNSVHKSRSCDIMRIMRGITICIIL